MCFGPCPSSRGDRVSGPRAQSGVAFVPGAGARRALGLFPRHFPVTFQRGGQFRGGPCPRPLHKGPAQPPATALCQPRRCPFRATMRGVSCHLLLGETSGLRGAGRELAERGQEGQGQAKPARTCELQKAVRGMPGPNGLECCQLGG